jgi:hypothetical protein
MSVRAIIAEDESVLRIELKELLAHVWPALRIVALAQDGAELRAIEEHAPDDVRYPDARTPAST